MTISEDTAEILKFLDYTTSDNLRKRKDLGLILEIAASNDKSSLINGIIFDGASLWNVNKCIINNKSEQDGSEKLASEVIELSEKLVRFLNELIPAELSKYFSNKYLINTKGAFLNLIDLAHDLSELKSVQLKMKHSANAK